ncbi:MAG: 3-methyl-2-oxobutanoate hydroxymethyltransferase [Elusimicrobia bacterium]|nr:3-methyl-2-oxobutanoate hydroxymethyltransferase [Elusimicrobiota bacterium]
MKIADFYNYKKGSQKISMVTAYDYTTAKIADDSNIDCVLVGDSLSMVIYGKRSTLWASTMVMAMHTSAVAAAVKGKLVIADMPFLSFRKGPTQAMNCVEKLVKAGAQAIKLEGIDGHKDVIERIVKSDIPVMGHLGLTPQSIRRFGGYKIQGKDKNSAQKILKQTKSLEHCGCFAIVLECIPQDLAKKITHSVKIPTIGIGAGPHTDGQVLVFHDLLGMYPQSPSFAKKYLDGYGLIKNALDDFDRDIKRGNYP